MKKENSIEQNKRKTNGIRLEDIKVRIHIPDNVSERTRQQKIDRIYDILSAKKVS